MSIKQMDPHPAPHVLWERIHLLSSSMAALCYFLLLLYLYPVIKSDIQTKEHRCVLNVELAFSQTIQPASHVVLELIIPQVCVTSITPFVSLSVPADLLLH